MIHSFSAADPTDPATIAGRWLENGAFVYFGSMNEPYLQAFRPPKLVAELVAAELPLSASLRQGEHEPYGQPWRLVYLGDPLYRLDFSRSRDSLDRLPPGSNVVLSATDQWRVEVIQAGSLPQDPPSSPADRLGWCLSQAIAALCHEERPTLHELTPDASTSDLPAWQSVAMQIDRRSLDPSHKRILDELLIDSLSCAGRQELLLEWMIGIPAEETGGRLLRAMETTATSELARLSRAREPLQALDLWNRLIRRPWPADSDLPALLTGRVASQIATDEAQALLPYRDRLRQASLSLASNPKRYPHVALIQNELERVEQAIRSRPRPH
jgi:hypothetical protein